MRWSLILCIWALLNVLTQLWIPIRVMPTGCAYLNALLHCSIPFSRHLSIWPFWLSFLRSLCDFEWNHHLCIPKSLNIDQLHFRQRGESLGFSLPIPKLAEVLIKISIQEKGTENTGLSWHLNSFTLCKIFKFGLLFHRKLSPLGLPQCQLSNFSSRKECDNAHHCRKVSRT